MESSFIKKRLQHRHFYVKIAKFPRAPILKNICERLLLWVAITYLRWLLGLRKLRSSEKVEILQIRLILRVPWWENIIFYYGRKKQRFFFIFTMELFSTALSYLFDCAVNFEFYFNIIFLNINKNQTSNEQYLN